METKNDILKELQAIAPKLAGMEKTNPYKLPEGYFMGFQQSLLERIKTGDVKAELGTLAPALAKLEKQKAAEIPTQYFHAFSSKLIRNIRSQEILNELGQVAPELAKIEKLNLAEVPVLYFKAFPKVMAAKIVAQQASVAPSASWVDSLNTVLDSMIAVIFKPKYSVAFAGSTTMVIIGVMMFMKIQQCTDLDCRFAQLSNTEINNYLDNKSDAYSDEVFEGNFSDGQTQNIDKDNNIHAYKDALKDVDDAALDAAISN